MTEADTWKGVEMNSAQSFPGCEGVEQNVPYLQNVQGTLLPAATLGCILRGSSFHSTATTLSATFYAGVAEK
jgi:hypothetical protein